MTSQSNGSLSQLHVSTFDEDDQSFESTQPNVLVTATLRNTSTKTTTLEFPADNTQVSVDDYAWASVVAPFVCVGLLGFLCLVYWLVRRTRPRRRRTPVTCASDQFKDPIPLPVPPPIPPSSCPKVTRISFDRPKVSFSPTDEIQDYIPEMPLGRKKEHEGRAFVPGSKKPMDSTDYLENSDTVLSKWLASSSQSQFPPV